MTSYLTIFKFISSKKTIRLINCRNTVGIQHTLVQEVNSRFNQFCVIRIHSQSKYGNDLASSILMSDHFVTFVSIK